jgi:hypothetical protein
MSRPFVDAVQAEAAAVVVLLFTMYESRLY